MYNLTKQENEEVTKLESLLFYSNGIPRDTVVLDNPKKAKRLEQLYEKKLELLTASLN